MIHRTFVDTHATYSKTDILKIEEDVISNYIVKGSPGSLGGEVDDACEFLTDCLSHVRREFTGLSEDEGYPISEVFRGEIDHVSVCADCGEKTFSSEQHQDLRLEVPDHEGNGRSKYVFFFLFLICLDHSDAILCSVSTVNRVSNYYLSSLPVIDE